MAFHQWLSSAPKHHLTSSTADGFSSFKSNNARPCSQQPDPEMDCHARRQMPPPPRKPVMTDNQAPAWTVSDPRTVAGHSVAKHPAPGSLARFLPITPPYEVDDMPECGSEVYPLIPDYDFCDSQVDPMVLENSNPALPPPGTSTTSPCNLRQSRDNKYSGINSGLTSKHAGPYAMPPSPPVSPQISVRPSPQPKRSSPVRHSSLRPKAEKVARLQTRTDPPRWTVNCTVLKSDTNIDSGNVVSPTCMIGLPFGEIVEMTLPLPSGDSVVRYRSV